MEAEDTVVTWCVGHLVSMSYPDAYDASLKKWSMATIPFIPEKYKYQVIDGVKKQFSIVKRILTDPQVDTIYICTDSGREGEYIYRLVASQAGVKGKKELRVWIDSQTQEEILRGIREAKPSSAYDNLGAAAYLRAREDYLMGINFSRALTLRYSSAMSRALGTDHTVIAVGRVMTCVLGMVVRREREIRSFVKTPFFRVQAEISREGDDTSFSAQWQVDEQSICYGSPRLYKDSGFLDRADAQRLILYLAGMAERDIFKTSAGAGSPVRAAQGNPAGKAGIDPPAPDPLPAGLVEKASGARTPAVIESIQRKKEKKNPPLLYNLAELQNDCSRFFKISPDQTLAVAQELYEKKLTTYPRTDARVLTTAVAKEIGKNLRGISTIPVYRDLLVPVLESGSWKTIGKSRYTNDKAVTDHYAIIPTGDGLGALSSLSARSQHVYELIVRRFISIFYPPAVFDRISVSVRIRTELFTASMKTCVERGYLGVLGYSFFRKKEEKPQQTADGGAKAEGESPDDRTGQDGDTQAALPDFLRTARKGTKVLAGPFSIREGETAPPKRYTSGSMILAMENAGQLIEDDELRAQIKGSGIGTSATRAEILKKLIANKYIALNKKTQILTPTQLGEMIYDVTDHSIRQLLNPDLTASWEKGLTYVAEGTITPDEYMEKLRGFIVRRTEAVMGLNNLTQLRGCYEQTAQFYRKKPVARSADKTGAEENK